jgi:polysaccharide biosynthesis transport protein
MNTPREAKLHLLDYWRVIKVRFGVVALIFLLVVITVGVTTFAMPKEYMSLSTIEVEPVRIFTSSSPTEVNDPKFTQTQFQIITRKGVLYPVIQRLDLPKGTGQTNPARTRRPSEGTARGGTVSYRTGKIFARQSTG